MNKSPWVGHWWCRKTSYYIAVVKQDGDLISPICYDDKKAETHWLFLKDNQPAEEIIFHDPGNEISNRIKVPIELIPFPPIEYMEEGNHEFELTENSYILYD